MKYDLDEVTTLRISAGKGYRTGRTLAENAHFLASSRQIVFTEELEYEEAWNYGINVSRDIKIGARLLKLNGEFYRTDFVNQVIIDLDASVDEVRIYNLDGTSFSNSAQIEAKYEPLKGFEVLAAYRYTDVKMTIDNELKQKPLYSKYKGLLNLSYRTKLKKWQFDFTLNSMVLVVFHLQKQIPSPTSEMIILSHTLL